MYDDISSCPERYLLWFHHVPWTYRMKSGRTVYEEMQYHYKRGVSEVEDFIRIWQEVDARMQHQLENARKWRDTCLDYFGSFTRQ